MKVSPISKLIIEQVKARPELWCSSHPKYRNKLEKERLTCSIARKLGMSPETLKKKWKNLKDHYRKELRKEVANTNGEGVWENNWPYWEIMGFLRNELFPKVTLAAGNIKIEEYTGDATEDYADSITSDPLGIEADREIETEDTQDVHNNQDVDEASVSSRKRPGSPLEDQELFKRFAFGDVRETRWIDEDYHFFVSLLPTMTSLSKIQKLEFRGKINQWLLELVKKNETQSTSHQ